MSDIFAAPDESETPRVRPRLCRAYAPDGDRCDLYWEHFGVHRDHSRRKAWHDEDRWVR